MTFNEHIQTLGVFEDGGIIPKMVQKHLRAARLGPTMVVWDGGKH